MLRIDNLRNRSDAELIISETEWISKEIFRNRIDTELTDCCLRIDIPFAELIEYSTELINDNTGLITETNEVEHTASGRRKRSRERGKDSRPRNFPLHTMKNLPQFRNKPHEEVRQHILETKGVDIGSNFNLGSIIMPILIVSAIVAGGYGLYLLMEQFQKQKEM